MLHSILVNLFDKEEKMVEKKKPTPDELAKCFIEHVARANDKHYWYKLSYPLDECMAGMNLHYYDKSTGWTPLTVAIGRASRYFGQHSPYEDTLINLLCSRNVTLDDLLKKPNKDEGCALHYAVKYPKTLNKMAAFLSCRGMSKSEILGVWRYLRGDNLYSDISELPERIFSPEFWEAVGHLDTETKMAYRLCPGFNVEWLLDDCKNLKEGVSNSTLYNALKKMQVVVKQDSKLKQKVDILKNGVKGVNLEYDCYSHYQDGHFGGPRFYDYDGSELTPDYLETLNQNFPNIESLTLPEFEHYKRDDFHYTIKNEIGDAQFEAITKFKKVKHLGVGYQPQMSSKAFSSIAGMKNLESVSFDNMKLKKTDIEKLLKLPKLQALSLDRCEYDEEWIRGETNFLCVDGRWISPKHPDYKKAKKIEEARLAEVQRIKSLTGKNWKEKFHEAMAKGHKQEAIEILKLNHVFDKRTKTHNSSFNRDKPEDVGPHILQHWGVNEMTVRDDCLSQDIVELGGENVAIATLYEDRNWRSNVGYSGGVGWYWNGEVAIVNLDKGVGQIADTGSLCVRHPTDSYRDIFGNIDQKDILRIQDGEAVVRLGDYASASVAIPDVTKTEDIFLRNKLAEKLKELRSTSALQETLKKGQNKAMLEAKKFHAIRNQKTALKFQKVKG